MNGWLSILATMDLRWQQPWWLLAITAVALPLVLAAVAARRGRRVQCWSVALQCLAVAMAAAAIAQPSAPIGPGAARPYMVLHDVSASMRGQLVRPLDWPSDLPAEHFVFASGVAAGDPAEPVAHSTSVPHDISAAGSRDQTNLGPALSLATARAGELAGAVLLSDGQWQDDAQAAAWRAAQARLPLWIVPMDSPPPDARVADLTCRRLGDGSVALSVTVIANAPCRRVLRVTRGPSAAVLLDRTLTLLPNDPATFSITDAAPADAAVQYAARLDAGDQFPENDELSCLALPQRQKFAVVGEGPTALSRLALGDASVVLPSAAPQDVHAWMDYSGVIVNNPAGNLLSAAQRAALAQYVRAGGGLVMIGAGPWSSPADRDDPLNRVLPLLADPYQRSPLHLVVVLDASGSMAQAGGAGASGPSKFDLARQAAASLQRHLTSRDRIKVITYSDSPRVVYDSTDKPPDFAAIAAALSAVRPAGGTKVMPALMQAAASAAPAGCTALVLLVSDLQTESYQADEVAAAEKLFRQNQLKLSVVATGAAAAESQPSGTSLDQLAQRLGAQYVKRDGLAGLAEVFQQFLRQGRGEPIRRGDLATEFVQPLLGMQGYRLGPAGAIILTAAQESAQVLGTAGGDPLLARGTSGLGRVVQLALPLTAGENDKLAASDDLARLIATAAKWSARPGDDPRLAVTVQRRHGKIQLDINARDDRGPVNLLTLSAVLQQPSLTNPATSPVRQIGPGKYVAHLPAAFEPAGLAIRDASGATLWSQSLPSGYGPEFAAIGANWPNLRHLAELTGGQIVSPRELDSLGRRLESQTYRPLWPLLLAVSLAIMLLDWRLGRVLRG